MKNEIERGCEVESLLSGLRGTVTSMCVALNGSVQCIVKRKGVDSEGKELVSSWKDIEGLKRIGNGVIGDVKVNPQTVTSIKLGEHVRHFNGFEGITFEKIVYFNGCVHFGVTPKVDKDNKFPENQYIACQYLTKVEDRKMVKTESHTNGGPETDAPIIE